MKNMTSTFTKEEAKETLLENSRRVCDPDYADDLLKPFGESMKSLGLASAPTKNFSRLNYLEADADKPSVAIYNLAQDLAQKLTGERVSSGMHGRGSYAEDITKKAVALL